MELYHKLSDQLKGYSEEEKRERSIVRKYFGSIDNINRIVDRSENNTVFHYICARNDIPLDYYRIFLKYGAGPNFFNNDGLTPFQILCQNDMPLDIYHLFLKYGANPNSTLYSDTPFGIICRKSPRFSKYMIGSEYSFYKLFLEYGANPNIVARKRIPLQPYETPFFFVCDHSMLDENTFILFLSYGAIYTYDQSNNRFNRKNNVYHRYIRRYNEIKKHILLKTRIPNNLVKHIIDEYS